MEGCVSEWQLGLRDPCYQCAPPTTSWECSRHLMACAFCAFEKIHFYPKSLSNGDMKKNRQFQRHKRSYYDIITPDVNVLLSTRLPPLTTTRSSGPGCIRILVLQVLAKRSLNRQFSRIIKFYNQTAALKGSGDINYASYYRNTENKQTTAIRSLVAAATTYFKNTARIRVMLINPAKCITGRASINGRMWNIGTTCEYLW